MESILGVHKAFSRIERKSEFAMCFCQLKLCSQVDRTRLNDLFSSRLWIKLEVEVDPSCSGFHYLHINKF